MVAHETGGSRLLVTSCVGCRARSIRPLRPAWARSIWPLRTELIIIHYTHERRHYDAYTSSSIYPYAFFGIAARPGPHSGRVRQLSIDRRLKLAVGFAPERFYRPGL